MDIMSRRGLLGRFAGFCAASIASPSAPSEAFKAPATNEVDKLSAHPQSRGEFLIRSAYVMTMDPTLGDIPGGDVHVQNGAIIAIGKGIQAPGAIVISGRGMIVLPGLVETH
jgi:5-methylthioadenosine/S-adenosylhomocysteine deaminase